MTHIEGAVLAAPPGLTPGVHAALLACVERVFAVAPPGLVLPAGFERVAVREAAPELEVVCAALASCRAHALVLAGAALVELEPRLVLALAAGMPARGGPDLVAIERAGRLDLRLALFRADALGKLRGLSSLADCARALEVLRLPAEWLDLSRGCAGAGASS